MELKGRVALVTGAARRIGRVIALALAGRGANVAVHYRASRAEAEETAAAIAALGVKTMTVRADLTREGEIEGALDAVKEGLGGLDVLVNSASVFARTPIATVTEAEWDAALDTNLKGPFLCSVHAARRMGEAGGAIVNISDSAIEAPYQDYVPYCVSKAGLVALTRALARALAPRVRVNAVGPGPVVTPEDLPDDLAGRMRERIPLKRHCTPEDVANAVVFMVEDGDYITGTCLAVDGGRSLA